jgi:hypothetical protein
MRCPSSRNRPRLLCFATHRHRPCAAFPFLPGDWSRLAHLSETDLDDMGIFVTPHRVAMLATPLSATETQAPPVPTAGQGSDGEVGGVVASGSGSSLVSSDALLSLLPGSSGVGSHRPPHSLDTATAGTAFSFHFGGRSGTSGSGGGGSPTAQGGGGGSPRVGGAPMRSRASFAGPSGRGRGDSVCACARVRVWVWVWVWVWCGCGCGL